MKVRVFIWFVPLSGVGRMCCCYACADVNARTTNRSSDDRASSLGYTGNLRALDKESERIDGARIPEEALTPRAEPSDQERSLSW